MLSNLESYFQNRDLGMTKEMYFELCETLGNEPIDDEIPVEFDDFPLLVQQSFTFYSMLRDNWDPMGGNYLGKDMSTIFEFFRLYDIEKEEQILHVTILQQIDSARAKLISSKKPKNDKPSPRKP